MVVIPDSCGNHYAPAQTGLMIVFLPLFGLYELSVFVSGVLKEAEERAGRRGS